MHEFGHLMGMIHEHQNPSEPIKWNETKLKKWAYEQTKWPPEKVEKQIMKSFSSNDFNSSKYDPDSIMLYSFPASVTDNNKEIKRGMRLSLMDVTWLFNEKNYKPTKDQLNLGNQIISKILKKFNENNPNPTQEDIDDCKELIWSELFSDENTRISSEQFLSLAYPDQYKLLPPITENFEILKNKNPIFLYVIIGIFIVLLIIFLYIFLKHQKFFKLVF